LAGFLEMNGHGRLWRTGLKLACAAVLAIGLSACTNQGENFFQRIGDLTVTTITGPEEIQQPELTRAELNKIPYATISVSADGGPRAYLVPLANNAGYLDYRDAASNSVRILGGAVAAFETTGYDLDAVRYDPADPIAYPRPLALWSASVWRQYQLSARHHNAYVISLKCVFQIQERKAIEIVEINFDLTRITEVCTNARRQVTNTYWIDQDTGFIWKSEQWLGPKIGHVSIELIRPFAE
jgi:hypothetical protein